MPLESILQKINKNAEEKAAAIKEESRVKRREIISRAESQATEIAERIVKEAKARAEMDRRRHSVSAELESRKEILREKQKILDDCFRAALDELLNLPAEEYRALIRRMLLNLVSSGDERVLISPLDEKRIDQKFIDSLNEEMKKSGRESILKLDGTSPKIRGGFVLTTEDVEVDCSFASLLAQLRDELQSQVAAILFGEGK